MEIVGDVMVVVSGACGGFSGLEFEIELGWLGE